MKHVLLLGLLAACFPRCGVSKFTIAEPTDAIEAGGVHGSSVLLVSTASSDRKEFALTQAEVFGKYFRFAVVSEEDDPECTFCGEGGPFFSKLNPFGGRSVGWFCAAQRQLKALRTAALLSAGGWVVLIDDDTAVNPTALMRLISRLSNNSRVGDEYGGGAGFIFGPEALRALSAPTPVKEMRFHMGEWSQVENVSALDLCVRRAEGGEWCRLHADWLIAHCMRASGAGLIKKPGFLTVHVF